MATKKKQVKQQRNQHSDEYRSEAIKLAARIGVTAAARQLGIHGSQIYGWRGKERRLESQSDAERRLLTENARLSWVHIDNRIGLVRLGIATLDIWRILSKVRNHPARIYGLCDPTKEEPISA